MISFRAHIFTILFIACLSPNPADACLQTGGTTIHGGRATTSRYHLHFWMLTASLNNSPEQHLEDLIDAHHLQADDDFPEQEVAGVKAVLMGNYEEAVSLFKEVEASNPGRYTTAANLGTAYELKGDLELALKWITEGIRRNPDAHDGTEWLHVEIIKTRMKLKEDPDFLRHNHVIDLPASFTRESRMKIAGNEFTGEEIINSLFHQLRERMIFVKPKDPVVADLLYTFGDLEGRTHVVEAGLKLLALAGDYGIQDPAALDAKINKFKWLIRFRMLWQTLLIVGLPIIFLTYAYKRKWFFLNRKAYRDHRAAG